jgi:cation transport regulator ChaC
MFKINKLVVTLILAMTSGVLSAPLAAAPRQVSASYSVTLNGVPVAAIEERFESTGGTYRIVSESNTVGLAALLRRQSATLHSSGRLLKSGLQPERFEGHNSGRESRQVTAVFDWAAQRLTLSHDDKTETAALTTGAQDRLSLMYQFMFLDFARLKHFDVAMTNGRKLDHYRYTVTPGAEIDTPLGRIQALHLVKQRDASDPETEIWLSPQHHFLAVKVLIVEKDGSRLEQMLTRLDIGP